MNAPARRTCRLVTLGCKVNQYETQFVKETLELNGYRQAADGEPADLCVVNTCTVTAEGDAKSRQTVGRLHKLNPDAPIVVMGCYASRDPQAVAKLPGVALVVTDKAAIADALRPFGVEHRPRGISRFDGHQRAFIKVQDGCLLDCSYCIIPKVRPDFVSRPADDVVAEIDGIVRRGCQEIVLTGVHLGHYGIDLSRGRPKDRWCRLWHLLRRIGRLPGEFRVRLSSLEAAEVRGELVDTLAAEPRVCPHLHLCLQSGSDRILGLMKRRYRATGFLERVRRLRAGLDHPAFTTDVIVGFPGETEADFQETCAVVREVGFSKVHVFPFSPRRGTPAAELPGQIPPPVVAERRQRLQDLDRELTTAYHRTLVGRRLDVMIEGIDPRRPGRVLGTSCRYAPVSVEASPALVGRRVPVRAVGVTDGVVLADPEPEPRVEPITAVATAEPVHRYAPGPVRIALPLAGNR